MNFAIAISVTYDFSCMAQGLHYYCNIRATYNFNAKEFYGILTVFATFARILTDIDISVNLPLEVLVTLVNISCHTLTTAFGIASALYNIKLTCSKGGFYEIRNARSWRNKRW